MTISRSFADKRRRPLLTLAVVLLSIVGIGFAPLPSAYQERFQEQAQRVWQQVPAVSFTRGQDSHQQPLLLQELSYSTRSLPTGKIVNLQIQTDSYWTAALTALDGLETLIPVFPAANDSRTAFVFVPQDLPGRYNLTVRVPRPKAAEPFIYEHEPPECMMYYLEDSARLNTTSRNWQQMRKFCSVVPGEKWDWYSAATRGGGRDFTPMPTYEDSVIFSDTLTFEVMALPDQTALAESMRTLAKRVHGVGASSFRLGGSDSLGYWRKDGLVGSTVGSLSYQPQPERCPSSFEANLNEETCKANAEPLYRWNPFLLSRADWLIKPEELKTCLKGKHIRFYGDSLGWGLHRGVSCLLTGYAGLDYNTHFTIDQHNLNVDYSPFYAPRVAGLDIDDEESAKLLYIDDSDVKPDIEIFLIGMWQISYTPSWDWSRGHDKLFSALKKHSERRGTKAFIAQATSPNSVPTEFMAAAWQSADRSYLWNQYLRDSASRHGFPIIDTFWPTVHRMDARTDNCHFCDYLYLDLAQIVMKSVCS